MKTKLRLLRRFGLFFVVLTPLTAWGWGKRGHQIVGEEAAMVVSSETNAEFMREHSFDFGYYANVPDFIWKKPATYGMEGPQHYFNIQVFERAFEKHPDIKDPFQLSRKEFDAKFPEVKFENGRVLWRIREMYEQLEKVTQQLRDLQEPTGKERQKLQERWIILAGTIAHYVGDLGMPLHVDENHDGDMTNQKGIHSYFEEKSVDQLYPELNCDVNKEALKKWPEFKKKNKDKDLFHLIYELALRSKGQSEKLLAMDKKMKRENLKANAQQFKPMIKDRLVDATLVLAEMYRRQLGWPFDGNKFYFWAGEPEYILPADKEAPAKK